MAQKRISDLTAATTPLGGDELFEVVQSGASRKASLSDIWQVRDTADNFETDNPVLAAGQTGYETDTGLFKFGDGTTAYNDLDYAAALSSGGGGMEIGTIYPYAGSAAPVGSLACDGSAISRTDYADLFAAIGTTWGVGDGSTTFNIPDLRGAFVRGTGSHGSEEMADGNPFAGPSVGAFEDDQMQGHLHEFFSMGGAGTVHPTGQSGQNLTVNSFDRWQIELGNVAEASDDGTNGPPRTGDETRPFNAGVLYCIKATPATNSGTPLPTYSYSTGWVTGITDWTDRDFTVTHGLNAPVEDLVVKVFIRLASGDEIEIHDIGYRPASVGTEYCGIQTFAINDSSFKLQTGQHGFFYLNDSGGTLSRAVTNAQATAYLVKVYRPEVLATELAVTKYDTGLIVSASWSGQNLTVTHNLNAPLSDLIVRFFIETTDGYFLEPIDAQIIRDGVGSLNYGISIHQVSLNQIVINTDANSFRFTHPTQGNIDAANPTYGAAKYQVVVYAPNLLENVQPAAVKSVSDDYTITGRTDSRIIQVTTGATDRTITLPAGTGMIPGDEFEIDKDDSGAGKVTITRTGSDTIDGVTSIDIDSQHDYAKLRWTGSAWRLVEYKDHGFDSSNGYWVRRADGTLEQRKYIAWSFSASNLSAAQTWTFPVSFISTNLGFGVRNANSGGGEGTAAFHGDPSAYVVLIAPYSGATLTTTQVQLQAETRVAGTYSTGAYVVATGRWRA